MRSWFRLCQIITASVFMLSGTVAGQAAAGTIGPVSIGFQGLYKVGYWTPIWVTLTAEPGTSVAGRLTLATPDSDGVVVQFRCEDERVSVPAGESVTVVRRVKFGRLRPELTVTVESAEGPTLSRHFASAELPAALATDSQLMLTVGDSIGEEQWLRGSSRSTALRHCRLTTAAQLPDDWLAYEGVDTVLLSTAENAVLSEISPIQLDALRQWVLLGGRLVMTLGARSAEMYAGPDASTLKRLTDFVPGEFVSVIRLARPGVLESYVGTKDRLDVESHPLQVAMLKNVRGHVELSAVGVRGEQPLVIRSPHGFGQVNLVTFDLDQAPLAGWKGRPHILTKLLRQGSSHADQAVGGQGGRLAHVGFTDLSGQLRGALDQFTDVHFVPFFWVVGLLFAYVLLIGPIDYFFLRRLRQRMHLTWITFPLIVIVFSAIAVYLFSQLKSDKLYANQVDVVDVDLSTATVRGSTWADVYSPQNRTYDFRWRTADPLLKMMPHGTQSVPSWLGLPGTGIGALNTDRSLPVSHSPYQVREGERDSSLTGLPIEISSTKALQLRWWGQLDTSVSGTLFEDADRLLHGEIQNPLPFELTDCAVLFRHWLYRLDRIRGNLPPGQSLDVDGINPVNLEYRLTRRRIRQSRSVSTPWDQQNHDVPRIVEMMMFHDAAGGDQYTRLKHRYQGYVDLSEQLNRGRAILLGRAKQRSTELEIDGQDAGEHYDQSWAFYRIVFPVRAEELRGRRRTGAGEPG